MASIPNKTKESIRPLTQPVVDTKIRTIKRIQTDLCDLFNNSIQTRFKRQFDVVSFSISTAALAMSTYNAVQIKNWRWITTQDITLLSFQTLDKRTSLHTTMNISKHIPHQSYYIATKSQTSSFAKGRILSAYWDNTCISAIFKQSQEGVKWNWQFIITEATERAYRIKEDFSTRIEELRRTKIPITTTDPLNDIRSLKELKTRRITTRSMPLVDGSD